MGLLFIFWKHKYRLKAYVIFETFIIVFFLNSKSVLMDVPEKYQSIDDLECPVAKGYVIECELMDKMFWKIIWSD